MSRRSRVKRFDEVFQIVLVIEAIFLEFTWTFVQTTLLNVISFVLALILWIWGNLKGGVWEYRLKVISFFVLFILLFDLLFKCAMGQYKKEVWIVFGGIVSPIASFFLGVLFPILENQSLEAIFSRY